jgi:hypothetical protein
MQELLAMENPTDVLTQLVQYVLFVHRSQPEIAELQGKQVYETS